MKFSRDCFSEWGHVPAGVPQRTKLGPCLFLLMINNLKVSDVSSWKYVDDTSVAEVVPSGSCSQAQCAADEVQSWSLDHKFQLNADKCKEMVVDLKKTKQVFDPIIVNNKELDIVDHAKILGLTISNDLRWNAHVSESIN